MYIFYVCVTCVYICALHVSDARGGQERMLVISFGTGVLDVCEPPCGCWKLNPSPPQGQQLLLTAEPLQPQQCLLVVQL